MMAASPAQNASGEIPVLGVASLAMKSWSRGAIFNPWASIRFMIGFSRGNGGESGLRDAKSSRVHRNKGILLATRQGREKAFIGPSSSLLTAWGNSDIGR